MIHLVAEASSESADPSLSVGAFVAGVEGFGLFMIFFSLKEAKRDIKVLEKRTYEILQAIGELKAKVNR